MDEPKKTDEKKLDEAVVPGHVELAKIVSDAMANSSDPMETTVNVINTLIREFHLTQEQIREIIPRIGAGKYTAGGVPFNASVADESQVDERGTQIMNDIFKAQ
jgi:hypothetical protein